LLGKPRAPQPGDSQKGSFLGPAFRSAEIEAWLSEKGIPFRSIEKPALYDHVARLLEAGNVVGYFQGRMEFGPRALGARSILGDPRHPAMQATMNLKIKYRESFRPFAPCVLQEHAADWFEMRPDDESPYMLLVAPVHESRRIPISPADSAAMTGDPDLRKRVNILRSAVPAVTHVDYSARVQTVDPARNEPLYGLLNAFYRRTGCPVLVNTSFNVRGEPIVCSPEDAYRCFRATGMDILVCENCVIDKRDLEPDSHEQIRQAEFLAQFQPD
jgi:carbamoyltransferase